MCVVISRKSIIFFEARLTFVRFLIENNKPDRFKVARLPWRALRVRNLPENISAGPDSSVTEQCLFAFGDAAEAHTMNSYMKTLRSIIAWGKTHIHDCPLSSHVSEGRLKAKYNMEENKYSQE